ncbi:MAG: hypothetical protein IPP26_11865 [Flavobacteriales bacterium]|nr:hypothetical protein [Flavobacteriales bacterium]
MLSTLFLVSCGGGNVTTPTTKDPALDSSHIVVQDTIKMIRSWYKEKFDTEFPQGRPKEVLCGRLDFEKYIHYGSPSSHDTIGPGTVKINVLSLKNAISALTCVSADQIKHGIIVHHGLDLNNDYTAFLQIVCLTYDAGTKEYKYEQKASGYTLNSSGILIPDPEGLTKWNDQGGPGHDYLSKVVLDRNATNTFVQYTYGTDVRSQIFPFETEIDELIADNHLRPEEFILLEPISEPQERIDNANGTYTERGFQQCVVWTPVGRTLDEVFDTNEPYKNKVADLGSPCPVTCAGVKFKFRKRGLRPRVNC